MQILPKLVIHAKEALPTSPVFIKVDIDVFRLISRTNAFDELFSLNFSFSLSNFRLSSFKINIFFLLFLMRRYCIINNVDSNVIWVSYGIIFVSSWLLIFLELFFYLILGFSVLLKWLI